MDLLSVTPSLEELLVSPYAFGLTTATPLQRALCRVIDGAKLGKYAKHPDVLEAFTPEAVAGYVDGDRALEIPILSAIRCAKSMICAAAAYRMARTCNLQHVSRNEPPPRVPVLSVFKDNAAATHGHLLGAIQNNPWMRATLFCEPTGGTITVRHAETGRPVEIKIIAGSRAGSTIASRWLAGLIFDEAPRMAGEEHVVNLAHIRANAVGRMLPGSKILYPGSPWAPYGPVYDMVQEHRGKRSSVFVCWAPGWLMNPVLWTPEKCAEMKANHPQSYRTDVEAKFASPGENLFGADEIEQCTRKAPGDLPYDERHTYFAAMDPATRRNAWTLIIATRDANMLRVAVAREWVPSQGAILQHSEILREVAEVCGRYKVKMLWTDQYHADSLIALARGAGLSVTQDTQTNEQRIRSYLNLKTRMGEGHVDLPLDTQLLEDLKRVQRVPTQRGGVNINLPHTRDGRHCDYAPALTLALHEYLKDAVPLPPTEDERVKKEAEALRKRVMDRAKRRAA